MDTILLNTKTRIPPQSERVLRRPRLIDALEDNLDDYKIILFSAPAGYGKTTALTQWAQASRFPVAWFSIDGGDNDLERFLRYLFAALEPIRPEIRESHLALLLEAMAPNLEAVLATFINDATELPEPAAIVLDDVHLIEEPSIYQALSFLIDHLPPKLTFVLASRGEPPLPLARYRARGDLLELDVNELRFLPAETRDYFAGTGLDLLPEEIDSLQTQTEGWIAGLQLAVLSLRQNLTPASGPAITGRNRFIADFLRQDVLDKLPADVGHFLLQTSLLDRLCAPLCEAVTEVEGSQEVLEHLESEGLFLNPLDDARHWFRYHPLFADCLREELSRRRPGEVIELHRRAANWHLAQDLPEPAFRHAVAGQDIQTVLEIFERYAQSMLVGGEFRRLQHWLDSLPAAWQADYPLLGLVRTGLLLFTGKLDACFQAVDQVERRILSLEREDTPFQLAKVNAIRCSIACFQNDLPRAEELAEQAYRDLTGGERFFRSIVNGSLGDTYRRNGRWKQARECYYRWLEFIREPAFRLQSAHAYSALADLELRQGHLQSADGYLRQALEAAEDQKSWGRLPLPLIGWMHIRMGELLYEWDELNQAREHLQRGLERAELGGDVRAMIAGNLIACRLALTEGDTAAAENGLEKAHKLAAQAAFAQWTSRCERLQLELWLAQDRLRAAVQWANEQLKEGASIDRRENSMTSLALARVLIVKGDPPSLERAQALLEPRLQAAQGEGRMDMAIEALALQSLAYQKRGQTANALTSLEQALHLAESEGYVRRFVDLGLPMGRLLQEARSRQVMPDYVDRLLQAFEGDSHLASARQPIQPALPEPLTSREGEVLELLAAGLTNREIAEELVISPETVKKHAAKIYAKLGVGSRSQAAARARELGLLG